MGGGGRWGVLLRISVKDLKQGDEHIKQIGVRSGQTWVEHAYVEWSRDSTGGGR